MGESREQGGSSCLVYRGGWGRQAAPCSTGQDSRAGDSKQGVGILQNEPEQVTRPGEASEEPPAEKEEVALSSRPSPGAGVGLGP